MTTNETPSDRKNKRTLEAASTISRVCENQDIPAAEIGNLVRHFRTLLGVEDGLPVDTKLWKLGELAFDRDMIADDWVYAHKINSNFSSERAGLITEALGYAVGNIPEKNSPQAKAAYEDMRRILERFDSRTLSNVIRIYKIVGPAMKILPDVICSNNELCQAFIQEIESRDDLKDEDNVLQVALSFARKHDKRDIAESALKKFDFAESKKFVMRNFDWIMEGASDSFIIKAIWGIDEIRNDQTKMDRLLRVLAQSKGLGCLLSGRSKSEFTRDIVEWALSNVSLVKYDDDITFFAYVGTDEQFPKLLGELEKRKSWRNIAYIRTRCHGSEKRHQAAEVLDRNVNIIPVSVDITPALYEIDPDSECGPSVFALIGTIGLDERARLRAVERIANEGNIKGSVAWRILAEIMKGHPRYRNATVEAAAREALKGMNALQLVEG